VKALRLALAVLVAIGALVWMPAAAAAQGGGDSGQELAEKWAPLVQIRAQADECDRKGEGWEPTNVDIVLDNPEVVLRDANEDIVIEGPSAADLFGLGEGYHLDFPGRSLSPGCGYERDFRRFKEATGTPPTIYAHIVSQPDEPDLLAVQYWLYWYFNDWNNTHESDWEGFHILFEASSIEEALDQEPVAVGFAQHSGGEKADWADSNVSKIDGRLVVYPSAGSHATYYGNALYLGRSASEGFGCDNTQTPSDSLDPDVIMLPDEVASADDPLAWLEFEGRWGEKHNGAFDGPTGPTAKDRWLNPIDWHEDLRDSSVVIPAGSTFGPSVTNSFCTVVEAGSAMLLWFLATPWLALGLTLLVLAGVIWAIRATKWSPVATEPLLSARMAGQQLRAAKRRYQQTPRTFVVIGLIFAPVAVIVALVQTIILQIPGLNQIANLFGGSSGPIAVAVTLLIGGLGNAFAFVLVSSAVAVAITREPTGGRGSAARSWAAVSEKFRALLLASIKSLVIVVLLMITIIGIPWGVRNAVWWSLIGQEVMLNGADEHNALKSSHARVTGSWWRTSGYTILVAGLAMISGTLIGLPLLLLTGLPLWLINVIGSLVFAVVVPYAAIAMTYMWGDRMVTAPSEPEPESVEIKTG
jgi:hypothetical protein